MPTLPREAPRPPLDDPDIYPRLDAAQLEVVARYGRCRTCAPGEVLFEQGERDARFYVLSSGAVDIVERRYEGDRQVAQALGGTFLGDTAMFTGQPTVLAGIVREESRVLEVEGAALRRLVAEQSAIGDVLLRSFTARRAWLEGHGYGQARLIGSRWSRETFALRDFMARNQVPFRYHDVESDDESRALLEALGISPCDTPVLVCGTGVHRNPTVECLATQLGLRVEVGQEPYDVLVVGAGPAGLAAAVYAASEGLRTLVVDGSAPGGQAGTSSKIENYLGFPTGLSGDELARRATLQARKFGVTMSTPTSVTELLCDGGHQSARLDDGQTVAARSVVIATGASYRRLPLDDCRRYEGLGVYFGATHTEALQCAGETVVIVGGGNSAGQAAVFLGGHAARVLLVVRGDSLAASMSRYLIDRIEKQPNVTLRARTEVAGVGGNGHLETVLLRGRDGAREETVETPSLFVMIGADPHTDWLAGCVGLDPRGFVVTGPDAERHPDFARHWCRPERSPSMLETTRPGVFAVGDVRSGSVKRVASAVGEGAMAVQLVHGFLARV